jgi:hypothetical protein
MFFRVRIMSAEIKEIGKDRGNFLFLRWPRGAMDPRYGPGPRWGVRVKTHARVIRMLSIPGFYKGGVLPLQWSWQMAKGGCFNGLESTLWDQWLWSPAIGSLQEAIRRPLVRRKGDGVTHPRCSTVLVSGAGLGPFVSRNHAARSTVSPPLWKIARGAKE